MHHRIKKCCLRILPMELSCCGWPIVYFVYDAPMTLRILSSENRCTRKVIGFVHSTMGIDASPTLKILPSDVAYGNALLPIPRIVDFLYNAPVILRIVD